MTFSFVLYGLKLKRHVAMLHMAVTVATFESQEFSLSLRSTYCQCFRFWCGRIVPSEFCSQYKGSVFGNVLKRDSTRSALNQILFVFILKRWANRWKFLCS